MRLSAARRGATARVELTPRRIPACGRRCARASPPARRFADNAAHDADPSPTRAAARRRRPQRGRRCSWHCCSAHSRRPRTPRRPRSATGATTAAMPSAGASRASTRSTAATWRKLTLAWTLSHRRAGRGLRARQPPHLRSRRRCWPSACCIVETATNIVIALDPEIRRAALALRSARRSRPPLREASSRGVSVWESSDPARTGPCRRRVFTGTLDARLLALDADSGRPCADFGAGGEVDLTRGIHVRDTGAYLVTSPPAIYRNRRDRRLGDRRQPCRRPSSAA